MAIGLFLLTVLLVVLRIVLGRLARLASVDEYAWMLQRREARRQNCYPPILPQFLLDVRQWSPPIYGRLLKILPDGFFEYRTLLVHLLAILRFANLLIFVHLAGLHVETEMLLFGMVVYLASPVLFTFDTQLNSRILASILFDVATMLVFVGWSQGWHGAGTGALVAVFVLLFFLHKLTMQLLAVLCIVWLAGMRESVPLACFGTACLLSFLFGYAKYLRAHWDISSFWFRNRRHVGAHQISDSPRYKEESRSGLSLKKHVLSLLTIFAMCPFILLPGLHLPYSFWQMTILATLGLAVLTTFVPAMKAWGLGRFYMYYQPSLVILSLWTTPDLPFLEPPWIAAISFCLLVVLFSVQQYRKWLAANAKGGQESFDEIIEAIRNSNLDRVMCIPMVMANEFAYRSGKSILWGGHGYGFRLLDPYFPVLRVTPEEAVRDWNLGAVVVAKSYWVDRKKYFPPSVFTLRHESESLVLYSVNGWENGPAYPQWARDAYPGIVPDTERTP